MKHLDGKKDYCRKDRNILKRCIRKSGISIGNLSVGKRSKYTHLLIGKSISALYISVKKMHMYM